LTEESSLRVLENRVLRVLENRVLRVLENRVLRVLESRVLRVLESRVLRVLESRVLRVLESRVLTVLESRVLRVLESRVLRVLESRVLSKIFGPKSDEVTGEWRKLHNEERNDLYYTPNVVRVIKSRRMRWAEHVACMGERRGVYRVLVGKPERERDHLEDPGLDGRIILR
jgi:hypothetical protein